MIRIYKIKQPKDINGLYILPFDLKKRECILPAPLLYPKDGYKHLIDKIENKNLLFAIICVVYEGKKEKTDVNSWGLNGVSINNVFLPYQKYILDDKNNIIYETDNEKDIFVVKRIMKLKKLKNKIKDDILYI